MAFVYDAGAQRCRFLGIPIPFCYTPSGNRAPGDPNNGTIGGPPAGAPSVSLGFGGVLAIAVVGLVVVLVVVNKVGRVV